MRILVLSQYFWPEQFRINDLVLGLKERGHDVEVLTGKPNYGKTKFYDNYSFWGNSQETWNGIKIRRAKLIPRRSGRNINLILNYISFLFFASLKTLFLRENYDKIFVFAPSPITSTIPGIILKRRKKIPVYLWVQDLWPDSVTATTNIKNKAILSSLNFITRWIYKNVDRILIQSETFKPSVIEHGGNPNSIIYFPNSVESLYQVLQPEAQYLDQLPAGFRIMFAGNIGEAQGFDTLLKAACLTKRLSNDIKWIVLGNGRKKNYVEQKILEYSLQDVFFLLGERPVEQMPHFFACADCLLVSLKKTYIFSLTIPSKLQSYLACKKPIIGSLDGEGARIIEDAQAGFVSPAEDPENLANLIYNMFKMTDQERSKLGNNARAYFELEFEREKLLDRLEEIFKSEL